MDLLQATHVLFGDCSQESADSDIYISTGVLTADQLEQVTAKAVELKAVYDSQAYARLRQPEYPPIGDQLDALWKGGDAQAAMLTLVNAVKTKYPKG